MSSKTSASFLGSSVYHALSLLLQQIFSVFDIYFCFVLLYTRKLMNKYKDEAAHC